mmetsp:Transcript_37721/g.117585  ORF Transcript_37721/g.117585 Transcript_37721/m.117585 type:complete len:290 (-) Transcript_37721:99-968(-)
MSVLLRRLCCSRRRLRPEVLEQLLDAKQEAALAPDNNAPVVGEAASGAERALEAGEPLTTPAEWSNVREGTPGREQAAALEGNASGGGAVAAAATARAAPTAAAEDRWPAPTVVEQHSFLDAAKCYNFAEVRRLVSANPRLVNCQPARRWSALHQAAHRGDISAIRFLLSHGADIQARTRDGLTPLEVASPDAFDLLLEATLAPAEEEAGGRGGPCTSDQTIARLHVWRFARRTRAAGEELQCLVCLQDLAEGDELRTLPCAHFFHTACIDTWLRERSCSCPTCRHQVV